MIQSIHLGSEVIKMWTFWLDQWQWIFQLKFLNETNSYFTTEVCGEVEALEIVLEAGAEAATADIHGAYPIHYAAQMCGQLKKQISPSSSSTVRLRRLTTDIFNGHTKRWMEIEVTDAFKKLQ